MDWSWMDKLKNTREYMDGVDTYIQFASSHFAPSTKIKCPCLKCVCLLKHEKEIVRQHLFQYGVIKDKQFWMFHGSSSSSRHMLTDFTRTTLPKDVGLHSMLEDVIGEENSKHPKVKSMDDNKGEYGEFQQLLADVEWPLYPGCKTFNKLSFIVRLFNIKCRGKMSNKSFDMLLKLLKEALPKGDVLPATYYELKKIIGKVVYDYHKIDACPNDCILYRKKYESYDHCPKCGECRWIKGTERSGHNKKIKVAKKVLRYFPLIPRLQRLYTCSKSSATMCWHSDERQEDGILRHPTDSPCWKALDAIDAFGLEPRNVRLGLASDGFNPFGIMSTSHSTWPVLLTPYNLPLWLCMKPQSIFLSLLIPGPKGPGNDIDVYLQPLIEELQILWHGVETFDAYKGEIFSMHAALLWTINDFPAYGYLSGWSTKGRLACPTCNEDTSSLWLKGSKKFCYPNHRLWLGVGHKFHSMKRRFDGKEEMRSKPCVLSGVDILKQLHPLKFTFGNVPKFKVGVRRKRKEATTSSSTLECHTNWKKKSIFFDLPYWKSLLLRHNLDVMHIEKNVCDSIIGTLLDVDAESKDGLKARHDLQHLGIRATLQPQTLDSNRLLLPPTMFTLSKMEKDTICNVLKSVKVPDGYVSNISRHVNPNDPKKIWGLKSQDCHVLMQQLLPVAMRGVTQKELRSAINDVCHFFSLICSKTSSSSAFYKLRQEIANILCRLEMIFLPNFFDIMVHLLIHLPDEARRAGPVQYRWIYPIERYLVKLKSYVRNRARPEGSMAEGYIAGETLIFSSRYQDDDVETWLNQPLRNEDEGAEELPQKGWDIFSRNGRCLGGGTVCHLRNDELNQAHLYILFNCEDISPYISMHLEEIRKTRPRASEMEIERCHTLPFPDWFKCKVKCLEDNDRNGLHANTIVLKDRPLNVGKKFNICLVNGFRFQTQHIELHRKTQNSGVVMSAKTSSFSSVKDKAPIRDEVTYYGVLQEILELNYYDQRKVLLFKCDWVDTQRGVMTDEGFTLVNLHYKLRTSEPYVLASQVEQVWYVEDPKMEGWSVVRKTKPRNYFDMQN